MNTHPMLAKALAPDGTLHLDASALEGRFMHCPREFQLYALEKREAVGERAGRDFGSFMHRVLAKHYRGQTPNIAKMWAADPPITSTDEWRDAVLAQQLYDRYCTDYATEPFDVQHVEVPFALPLCEIVLPSYDPLRILYTGRIDATVKYHTDGTVWVVDHKTSSIAGETFWLQWENSTAQHGYVWAAEQLLRQYITGFVINALFVRKPTRTGLGLELARQTYMVGYSPDSHSIALERWFKNTCSVAAHMAACLTGHHFPQHTSACVRRYGACEYLQTCRLSPVREDLINTNLYQDVTWTPLD